MEEGVDCSCCNVGWRVVFDDVFDFVGSLDSIFVIMSIEFLRKSVVGIERSVEVYMV